MRTSGFSRRFFRTLFCGLALCALMAGSAQATVIVISGTNPAFVDTGFNVTIGDLIAIDVTGLIGWGGGNFSDANGEFGWHEGSASPAGFLVENTVPFGLVGRIGASTLVTEGIGGNGAGFVGTTYSQLANATGTLFLGFNDDFYGDNSGSFTVTLVPEPPLGLLTGLALLGLAAFRRRSCSD